MSSVRMAQAPDVVTRRIGDEVILVPVRSKVVDIGSVFTLSESGALIWELLGESLTRDQIIDRICETFDVDRVSACADVDAFLETLQAADLAVAVEES